MITENEVVRAINLMTDTQHYAKSSINEQLIANELESCMDKGKFDGTKDSAISCLQELGFEIELETEFFD